MNIPYKQFQIFILFFSVLLCTPIYTQHDHVMLVGSFANQTHCREIRENKSHCDYSYDKAWNNIDTSLTHKSHFSRYTKHDFQNHFTAHEYTEKEILNQRCLYMFDEFVKFAQTYSSYKCTIQQLHAQLKNLNIAQKVYYTIKGTYCRGLQKRIHYLYNQLSTLKNEAPTYKEPAWRDHSIETFHQQHTEYKALGDIYHSHIPSLSNAIEKRIDTFNDMTKGDYALRYANKSYNLNNDVKQLLNKYGHDTTRFTQCYGHQLHQALHQESLDLLDHIDSLPSNSLLYDHQEALIDFTVAIADYNHEGITDKAMNIADFCWTLLDYGQAIAEGAALGAYTAVTDLLHHPIEATVNIVAGKQVLMYQLSKVLYNVADIGITALSNVDHAKDKWNKYAEPLNNIIDAINKKEITLRDAIKGGTAFVVGYKVQGKLLGGLGKFCNTIKQKGITFAKKSSWANPQKYLTTPEGLLFKATVKSNKLKQSGSSSTASSVKTNVDNRIAKNKSIQCGKSTAKQIMPASTGGSKGIIRNIKEDLRSTITRYKDHIFSQEHEKDGILALGKDKETIMDSLYNTIMTLDKKGLLQEGPNQLRVKINGIDNVEIRCFIQSGEAISVNAFISNFGRIFNNFIDTTKV